MQAVGEVEDLLVFPGPGGIEDVLVDDPDLADDAPRRDRGRLHLGLGGEDRPFRLRLGLEPREEVGRRLGGRPFRMDQGGNAKEPTGQRQSKDAVEDWRAAFAAA